MPVLFSVYLTYGEAFLMPGLEYLLPVTFASESPPPPISHPLAMKCFSSWLTYVTKRLMVPGKYLISDYPKKGGLSPTETPRRTTWRAAATVISSCDGPFILSPRVFICPFWTCPPLLGPICGYIYCLTREDFLHVLVGLCVSPSSLMPRCNLAAELGLSVGLQERRPEAASARYSTICEPGPLCHLLTRTAINPRPFSCLPVHSSLSPPLSLAGTHKGSRWNCGNCVPRAVTACSGCQKKSLN